MQSLVLAIDEMSVCPPVRQSVAHAV